MLIRLVFASILALIGITVYCVAKKKHKKEGNDWQKSLDYIENNVNRVIIKGLPLAGTSIDDNSDVEVSEAIQMTNLPDDVRIKIYD